MELRKRQRYAFLLRIWREKGLPWRGWVQHIDSRESTYFKSLPDLLAFIQAWTGNLEVDEWEEESAIEY